MRKLLLFAFTGATIAMACNGPTGVDSRDYDRGCTAASDCVPIVTDACGCACDTAAINVSAESQYEADFAAAKQNCGGGTGTCGVECPTYGTGCSDGVCVLTLPTLDAGPD